MIDIIIPCYNAQSTLDNTLQSIAIQSIKDKVKVLLVDDCSKEGYDSFIERYKNYFDISCLRLDENGGAGIARQRGIENTNSKYISFIDSDDNYFAANSLELLFNEIEKGYDYVNSVEYDQKRDEYMLLNGNIHGKIYRRKYIEDKKIHFCNTRYHEDNYFNNLVRLCGAYKTEVLECTYFYTYNKNSITNSNTVEFDRLEIYLNNMKELLDMASEYNYDKVRIAKFKVEKYRYLKRIYKGFSKEEKDIFIEWLKKYDNEFLKYINLSALDFEDQLFKDIIEGLTNE